MRGAVGDGKVIRELRRSLGLTQEKLAARSACDVKTIRHAEHGKALDVRTLSRIAEGLDTVLSSIVRHANGTLDQVQRNIQQVHRWRRAFNARDVEGVLAIYHDEAVLIYPEGSPGGGVFRGKAAIRRQAEIAFECFETKPITPKMMQAHAVDNVVFVRGKTSCTVRATGVTFTLQVVHEFQFDNGLVIQHTGLFDTLSMAKGLNPEAFGKKQE
jgi:ketosteroid isomerase-like protein/DNA-binding XRE family transcriptional regulator